MSTVVFDFHCKTAGKGRVRILPGNRQHNEPGNTPRITRLMALAIKFDQLLREGTVRDYADLARLGHVTRARMTQIMGLLNLAVDIQEEILNLPKTIKGRRLQTENGRFRKSLLSAGHASPEPYIQSSRNS